jgi:seryl-tRNA synthetase
MDQLTYNPTTLDISCFKKGNLNLHNIKESQKRRGKSLSILDKVTQLDDNWRTVRYELDLLNGELNKISKLCKSEQDTDKKLTLIQKGKELKENILQVELKVQKVLHERDEAFNSIGNLVHPSVPVSMDENNNNILRTWGNPVQRSPTFKHHHELLHMIGGYESEMGAEVAGHRGYYLTGFGMLLNNAIIQYAIQFLAQRKYTPVQTPFFMKQTIMKKVAALAEFDEALYKVTGDKEDEPMYLIATSEQPLCALNMNKSFSKKQLPLKYCGYSTNFRKEAGSHGRDAWGIFRIHQFEKIEQFVICDPEKSWDMQNEMMSVSEEFYKSLNLAYQVIDIVSGELNNAAARKYDLEAWFPTLGLYRELVSCSNCTDYQSKRLNIKLNGGNHVHMLNSTLTASERTLCCILENYQTEKGIIIPDVLKPFMEPFVGDLEDANVIPFINGPPKMGKGGKGQKKGE